MKLHWPGGGMEVDLNEAPGVARPVLHFTSTGTLRFQIEMDPHLAADSEAFREVVAIVRRTQVPNA
jgi:hypothetical protein